MQTHCPPPTLIPPAHREKSIGKPRPPRARPPPNFFRRLVPIPHDIAHDTLSPNIRILTVRKRIAHRALRLLPHRHVETSSSCGTVGQARSPVLVVCVEARVHAAGLEVDDADVERF